MNEIRNGPFGFPQIGTYNDPTGLYPEYPYSAPGWSKMPLGAHTATNPLMKSSSLSFPWSMGSTATPGTMANSTAFPQSSAFPMANTIQALTNPTAGATISAQSVSWDKALSQTAASSALTSLPSASQSASSPYSIQTSPYAAAMYR